MVDKNLPFYLEQKLPGRVMLELYWSDEVNQSSEKIAVFIQLWSKE